MRVKDLEQDYTVRTEFMNRDTGERYTRVYPLSSYCQNVSFELKQVLYEAESAFYRIENYKDRDQWSEESKDSFAKIRKKLLNHINGIARLPSELCYQGIPCNSVPASKILADMIDNK